MCKRLTHHVRTGSVTELNEFKFFEWITGMSELLTYPFERLIKISKRVPKTTERLTLTIISQFHFTKGRPVSPGMKLLLHRIDNNYCLRTHISI